MVQEFNTSKERPGATGFPRGAPGRELSKPRASSLVPIVRRLVGPFDRHADVVGLVLAQRRQLHAQLVEVQARHFFIQLLRQDVDAVGVVVGARQRRLAVRAQVQVDLRQHLVGERRRHHERRVAGGAAEVQQAAFGQHQDAVLGALAVRREHPLVVLRLDLHALGAALGEAGHVDLVVEVADVADDGLVLHPLHVVDRDDVLVAGRGDEDVGGLDHVLERRHLVAFHRRLQRADRVDLGDDHAAALALERLGAALADVAVAEHHGDLGRQHHVAGAVEAVDQRVAAAVEVVELALGGRVVDVDRREQQRVGRGHLVEAVHAGGRLFADALDAQGDLRPHAGTRLQFPARASRG